jgi:hypothetical protein
MSANGLGTNGGDVQPTRDACNAAEWHARAPSIVQSNEAGIESLTAPQIARRGFMLASLGFLAACASSGSTGSVTSGASSSPSGLWLAGGELPPQRWAKPNTVIGHAPATKPATVTAADKPVAATGAIENGFTGKVIPRTRWTGRNPDLTEINPMLPVKYITVHHEGMEAFTATSSGDTIERLQRVWNGHDARGFGDIGYHFVIDRSGRIWEGRSLRYQGAHVRAHNEGNIGVMCLGNFDEQSVSPAQRKALEHQLKVLATKYGVKRKSIRTHKEWNPTACPGKDLQRMMGPIRSKMA